MNNLVPYDPAKIAEAEKIVSAIPTDVNATKLIKYLLLVFEALSGLSVEFQRLFMIREVRKRLRLTVDETRIILSIVLKFQRDGQEQSIMPYSKMQRQHRYSAFIPDLVDIVDYNGHPVFLVKNAASLEPLEHVEVNGEVLSPPLQLGSLF
jgi:hypothetical protein